VAELVYTGKVAIPDGWVIDGSFNQVAVQNPDGTTTIIENGELSLANGFYAYALKPSTSNTSVPADTRVLAFRGTEFTLATITDLYGDADSIGASQFGAAASTVNQWVAQQLIDGNNVELVGHSLGGALVQWAINDTNLKGTGPSSVTELARTIDSNFVLDPAQLHFYTFNAPGITNSPGVMSAADRQTDVTGEHHVITGSLPFVLGDPVHLLSGQHVGGQVLGHQVDFLGLGDSPIFAHTIKETAWWDSPVNPAYVPPYIDLGKAHVLAANFSRLGDTDGTVDSEREAIFRLGLFTAATIGVEVGGVLGRLGAVLGPIAPFIDTTVLANAMASGTDRINDGLRYLLTVAKDHGIDVVAFGAQVLSAIDTGMISGLELLFGGGYQGLVDLPCKDSMG
jgi:hypothetical protein